MSLEDTVRWTLERNETLPKIIKGDSIVADLDRILEFLESDIQECTVPYYYLWASSSYTDEFFRLIENKEIKYKAEDVKKFYFMSDEDKGKHVLHYVSDGRPDEGGNMGYIRNGAAYFKDKLGYTSFYSNTMEDQILNECGVDSLSNDEKKIILKQTKSKKTCSGYITFRCL